MMYFLIQIRQRMTLMKLSLLEDLQGFQKYKTCSAHTYNKQLNESLNPDEAVACGAAIQAAILQKNQHTTINDMILLDVTPLSLGVNIKGEITSVIIERNTMIPVKKTETFVTSEHNQTKVWIDIVEGLYLYFALLLNLIMIVF